MPDPTWPSSPPEANYLRLVGPGAAGTATTLASAGAWQALMGGAELAFTLSSANTAVTAVDFEGVGGLSSAGTVTALNTALQVLAGWVQEKPPIAAEAVAAYDAAVSAMIPAEVSLANRAEQAADVAMNPLVWGALTPAIVALDAEYFGEHWPHNAGVGAAYGAALTALTAALSVPPPPSPPGASPAGPAVAAAAVAQSAGEASAEQIAAAPSQRAAESPAGNMLEQMGSVLAQPLQAAMGAMAPVAGMFQMPLQALQSMSGLTGSLGSRVGGDDGMGLPDPDGEVPGALVIPSPAGVAGAGVGGAFDPVAPTATGPAITGAGLTAYARPQAAVVPENGGRPAALKPGLLSAAAELRGPTTSVPAMPGPLGVPPGRDRERSEAPVVQARIVLREDSAQG